MANVNKDNKDTDDNNNALRFEKRDSGEGPVGLEEKVSDFQFEDIPVLGEDMILPDTSDGADDLQHSTNPEFDQQVIRQSGYDDYHGKKSAALELGAGNSDSNNGDTHNNFQQSGENQIPVSEKNNANGQKQDEKDKTVSEIDTRNVTDLDLTPISSTGENDDFFQPRGTFNQELGEFSPPPIEANIAPTDISVNGGEVAENSAAGTVVATLAASDQDAGESFIFSLAQGSDNFEIIGNEIRVKPGADIDFEKANLHELNVVVTDSAGNTYSETVIINVGDVDERNIITGTENSEVLSGTSFGDIISGLAGNDSLYGGDGDDRISGGDGNDVLYGQDGNDLFIFGEGNGNDTIYGGTGTSWTDVVDLQSNTGLGDQGTDWTVKVTSGSIIESNENSMTLSDDADGVIVLQDGSELQFRDIEVVQW